MKKKINDITIRKDLYPRFEVDNRKVQEYSENIENLPPIVLNQDDILIDGLHRLKAHKQAELKEIDVIVEKTESENELYLRAIELNATHGLQLSYKDKQSLAVRLYDLKNRERLIKSLSISPASFDRWVSNKAKQMKEQKEEEAINTYLKAELSQKEVAEIIGVSEAEMSRMLQNTQMSDMKDFTPFLYNIWNSSNEDNSTKHFGLFPEIFMENLIYYYTNQFDIVYDPFGGGGTTIDVCKKWLRRYYVSDLNPIPAREEEIKKWDIKNGLPKDLSSPNFVFLDPPYWLQAKEKYSKSKNDLGNMNINEFYKNIENFIKELKKKMKNGYVAFVISPTQWPNEKHKFEDHIIKIINIFEKNGFKEEIRYILPYSTEQYNGNQVNIAKKEKFPLSIIRDLVIFKKIK